MPSFNGIFSGMCNFGFLFNIEFKLLHACLGDEWVGGWKDWSIEVFLGCWVGGWIRLQPTEPPFRTWAKAEHEQTKMKVSFYSQTLFFSQIVLEDILIKTNIGSTRVH